MDAYLQALVSCHLYMIIIRQKKRDFGEIKKNQKDIIKRIFRLELCLSLCVYVCVCIFVYCCVYMLDNLKFAMCHMANLRLFHEYICSDM